MELGSREIAYQPVAALQSLYLGKMRFLSVQSIEVLPDDVKELSDPGPVFVR